MHHLFQNIAVLLQSKRNINYLYRMKENKKAILEFLKKKASKKDGKFENLVLNLALQKIDSDCFEYDGDAVYTNNKKRLVYCMSQEASFAIPEGVEIIGEMAFRGKKALKNAEWQGDCR